MGAREAIQSPIPQIDGSIVRKFIIEGTTDDDHATQMAFAAASPTYRGRGRVGLPEVNVLARGVWEFDFTYIPPGIDTGEKDPQGDLPTLGTIEIDGSGGTQHVTQCLQQAVYGVTDRNFSVATTLYGDLVVGFHKDGVHGVDIDIPGTTYTLTKKWLPQAIGGDYLYRLSQLRGKINYYFWSLNWGLGNQYYSITFEPAELRFLGHRARVSITSGGLSCWEISYVIHHSANKYNLDMGNGITVAFKGGQHYLWVLYKKLEVAGGVIEVPDLVCQSRLYDWEDFGLQMGF